MPDDFVVHGAEKLAALSRALKSADKELKRETFRGLNRAVKPMRAAVKASAEERMPSGYGPTFAKSLRIRTRRRTDGITLVGTAKGNPRARKVGDLEAGRLRHPLFGDREHWYTQRVQPGFWSKPLEASAPLVRRELIKVMDDMAEKIARQI